MQQKVKDLMRRMSLSVVDDEDLARRKYILNVLLVGTVVFSTISGFIFFVNYFYFIFQGLPTDKAGSPLVTALFVFLFWFLLLASKKGFYYFSTYVFIGTIFLAAVVSSLSGGADVPQSLLVFVLVIVMSGILVGTAFAVFAVVSSAVALCAIAYLQIHNIVVPNLLWRNEFVNYGDIIVYVITFGVIALVSWLSNREMEKSLFRARTAEQELRKERDSLEIKVKERTKDLERAQFEKTVQMHHFVEFGRAASGLFHDMVNPVQAAMLSLFSLKRAVAANDRKELEKAVGDTTAQMEKVRSFIDLARMQITRQEIDIVFDPEEQIALILQMLSFRAKREKVEMRYTPLKATPSLKGNPLSFNRLISGLVSNAIDAYDGVPVDNGRPRTVTLKSEIKDNTLVFSVSDNGKGISEENQKKVFELFFTTKGLEKGTGVGLSLSKQIAENSFGGSIHFESKEGVGSVFTVMIPLELA